MELNSISNNDLIETAAIQESNCDIDSIWIYGSHAQSMVSDFSKTMSSTIAKGTTTASERALENAIESLNSMTSSKGIFGMAVVANERKFKETIASIDELSVMLRLRQAQLLKEINIYERMDGELRKCNSELDTYISVGEARLINMDNRAAVGTEDAYFYNDEIEEWKRRFENKIAELRTTRLIAQQSIVQVNLMRNNNVELTSKIASALSTTIPLWRNNISLSYGLEMYDRDSLAQKKMMEVVNKGILSEGKTVKKKIKKLKERADNIDVDEIEEINNKMKSMISEISDLENKMDECGKSMMSIINNTIA